MDNKYNEISLIGNQQDGYETFNLNCEKYSISKWLVNEGDYVIRNQILVEIVYEKDLIKIFSTDEGFIEILNKRNDWEIFKKSDLLFSLYKNDNIRLKNRYCNEFIIETDLFTNEQKLIIKKCGIPKQNLKNYYSNYSYSHGEGRNKITINDNLNFSIENHLGKDYICFEYYLSNLKLKINDQILFLMSNGFVLEFNLIDPYSLNSNYFKGFKIPLYEEEINILNKYLIEKIRIKFTRENYHIDNDYSIHPKLWYSCKKDFQYVVQSLFKDYIYQLTLLKDYSPLSKSDIDNQEQIITHSEKCAVYLMHDNTNNFFKIGISNKPEYREFTLQSEKPTIELITFKYFPSRKIAESIEKALHNAFKEFRIRGEWFNLESNEVDNIKETLR